MEKTGIELVVFDLAGTVVDHGSRAPAGAFIELFRRHGIEATDPEARAPMGKHKRDHIAEMLAMPSIARQWRQQYGTDCGQDDIDRLFSEFLPLQLAVLPDYADAIPGAAEAIAGLADTGVKTAATTGYNREMTTLLLGRLAEQGIVFDYSCCAAEVPAGRPEPWMIYRCMEALRVYPPHKVLNVGDTIADVEAGVNASVWSAGVVMTGNLVGPSEEEVDALEIGDLNRRVENGRDAMLLAGADLVMRSVAETLWALREIDCLKMRDAWPGYRPRRNDTAGKTLNRILEKTISATVAKRGGRERI